MLTLEKHAKAILTDSGGVQKEAYWFKVPCITLREETEWIETVTSGWNVLTGTESSKIIEEMKQFDRRRRSTKDLFGNGRAGEKMIQIITKYFR
jgi:UDP-N-acetylglucosamine 2-epimerase